MRRAVLGVTGDAQHAARTSCADGLAAVRARIERGCAEAGRDPAERDAHRRHEVLPGLRRPRCSTTSASATSARTATRRPGEKFREVRRRSRSPAGRALTLHFIGQLQSNKAAHVAGYADVVESVDRAKLVAALAKGAHAADRRLEVLLQVEPRRRAPSTRRRCCPARPTPSRTRRRGRSGASCYAARRHGRRAAGRRPRRGVRPPARRRGRHTCSAPGADWISAGHERRPRGGAAARRDTPACRHRNPRFAPVTSVTSSDDHNSTFGSWPWQGHCARRWCTSD